MAYSTVVDARAYNKEGRKLKLVLFVREYSVSNSSQKKKC